MSLKHVKDKVRRGLDFTFNDIWDIEVSSLPRLKALGINALRVLHLVGRGFRDDECPLHASALTFSTLMAIVPILAFSLALARGFGGGETAKAQIRKGISDWTDTFSHKVIHTSATNAPAGTATNRHETEGAPSADVFLAAGTNAAAHTVVVQEEQLQSWLANQINEGVEVAFEKVDNISFTALGSVGLVLLLWMIIQVLGHVERAFNSVWGVSAGRSLWRRFTDYLSVIVVMPILALAASSLPVVDLAAHWFSEDTANMVRAILGSGLLKQVTVLLMTTLCFAFMIVFMPNTKVKKRAGLVGGLITALLFIAWLKICAALQIGVARSSRIYGSFAVVPIVLAWVYVSWEIILFGAEVAFAVQNCDTYRMEQGARHANVRSQLLLALAVIAEAARTMLPGKETRPGFDVAEYARTRKVPIRFLNEIVRVLVEAGFLAELSGRQGHYAMLKAPGALGVHDVMDAVLVAGVKADALGLAKVDRRLEAAVDTASCSIGDALQQQSIEDLIAPRSDSETARQDTATP